MTSMLLGLLIVLGCFIGIFIAARFRKRTGLLDVQFSPRKSLAIAAVTATIVSGAIFLLYLREGLASNTAGSILGLCLIVWLCIFGSFYVLDAISRSSKSLRGREAFGMVSVFALTGLYLDGADQFLMFWFPGVLIGIVAGILSVPATKRRIVGNKMILPRRFPDRLTLRGSLAYWKETLLVVIGAGVGCFLFKYIFLSSSAWMGMLLGFGLGMTCYRFLWVCGYERRNGIRITIQQSGSDQISQEAPL